MRSPSIFVCALVLLLAIFAASVQSVDVSDGCLSSGDQNTINNLLTKGGQGAVVSLCASSVFKLTAPVYFTAPNQELSTAGYPTGSTRAMLIVTGKNQTQAIGGTCGNCANVALRNIQVNGNRPALGRYDPGSALIEVGQINSGVYIDNCHVFEPRAWSAMHIIEGAQSGAQMCRNATITNNQIGPSGNSNQQWADGISMACSNSVIAYNTITDATDGAIVLFGAPGTKVHDNTIIANTRVLLGGVNMVDHQPYSGNFTGVVVSNNVINGAGALIKVGVAIGPAVWGDNQTAVNFGAIVQGNILQGNLGYGIAASGAQSFTVVDNVDQGNYHGSLDNGCPNPPNGPPMAFLYNAARVSGNFQSDFANGRIQYLICIQPGFSNSLIYQPGQLNLKPGQGIQLANATLDFQGDGNIVMYDNNGKPLWASGTSFDCNSNTCELSFETNGYLALFLNNNPVQTWPSSYGGNLSGSSLTLSAHQPYLQVSDSNMNVIWSTLYTFPSFNLKNGQFILQSVQSSNYFLTTTNAGNLEVHADSLTGKLLWGTGKSGQTCNKGCVTTLQGDGNLVGYDDQGVFFATGTNGADPGAAVRFNPYAPYVQVLDAKGSVLYSSG